MRTNLIIPFVILLLSSCFSACKKKSSNTPPPLPDVCVQHPEDPRCAIIVPFCTTHPDDLSCQSAPANLVWDQSPASPMIVFVTTNTVQTVRLKNIGGGTVSNIELQKPQEKPVTLIKDHCAGKSLGRNDACDFQIKLHGSGASQTKEKINFPIQVNYFDGNNNQTLTSSVDFYAIKADTPEIGYKRGKTPADDEFTVIREGNVLTFKNTVKAVVGLDTVKSGDTFSVTVHNQSQTKSVQLSSAPILSGRAKINVDDMQNNTCTPKTILHPNATCTFTLKYNKNITDQSNMKDLVVLQYQYQKNDGSLDGDLVSLSQYISYYDVIPDFIQKAYHPDSQSKMTVAYYNAYSDPVWLVQNHTNTVRLPAFGINASSANPKGESSLQTIVKTGCDESGVNCLQDKAPVDIHTKYEITIGCDPALSRQSTGDPTTSYFKQCAPNPSGSSDPEEQAHYLSNATFMDTSLVDGYTVPISYIVIPNENEDNDECHSVEFPTLDTINFSDCPSTEDVSLAAHNWDINAHPEHWDYHRLKTLALNHEDDGFWSLDTLETLFNTMGDRSIIPIDEKSWKQGVDWLAKRASMYETFNITNSCLNVEPGRIEPDKHYSINTPNLKSVDLKIYNPNKNHRIFGCASPKSVLSFPSGWKTANDFTFLGLGTRCVEKAECNEKNIWISPSDPQCAPTKADPAPCKWACFPMHATYLNQNLFYQNPMGDRDLLAVGNSIEPLDMNKDKLISPNWTTIWPDLKQNFCKENPNFCYKNQTNQDPRPALASIVGSAAVIGNTQYFNHIMQKSTEVYSWQYGDKYATRVCNQRPKIVIVKIGSDIKSK